MEDAGSGSARASALPAIELRELNPFAKLLRLFGSLALPLLYSITPPLRSPLLSVCECGKELA